MLSIKNWPENDRPREKLLAYGAEQLSDSELLALFLQTGTKEKSAVDLAREMIGQFGSLNALLNATKEEICSIKGIGKAKYALLQAGLEIAKRTIFETLQEKDNENLSDTFELKHFLKMKLGFLEQEVFAALLFDSQSKLISFEILAHGTINRTHIYPRELAKIALKKNAAYIILAHNHPSGITTPSKQDIVVTQKLKAHLTTLDLTITDHFIVGKQKVISLMELGYL